MPPTGAHFNGSVNLVDAEAVMREIAKRVPAGVRRIPDGETGDRQQWVFFQLEKFWQTPGLEQAVLPSTTSYGTLPKARLAEGADPENIAWPDLGYANAYLESYEVFRRLRDEGVIPADVRFQVEYPTPLASISGWIMLEDQDRLEPSYQRALFADLQHLLAELPHDEVAVQWDVAVEFAILEGAFERTETQTFGSIVERLARCVDQVPADVPVGLHLCYGDFQHQHYTEPESLDLQVRVANEVGATAVRPVSWFAFTIPQYQRDPAYFTPLRELTVRSETELYFALVPYDPDQQEPGTTSEQVRLVDAHLGDGGVLDWGVCTECGMGRAEREDIPRLLDLHREIVAEYST